MRILITGSEGLLGWHSRVHLATIDGAVVDRCSHRDFDDDTTLIERVGAADAIYHLAGVNRGTDAEVELGNRKIAERLVEVLERAGASPHVIFSSSTHIARDTPYGRSKRAAADTLRDWSARSGGAFLEVVLPHVFGEFGRPFYNSVVSTFCHQIVHGEVPTVENDGELALVHAQGVARRLHEAAVARETGKTSLAGHPMTVRQLLAALNDLHERYRAGVVPHLDGALETQLFNTLRSYIPHREVPRPIERHTDDRGGLFEAIRSDTGGQVFLSTTRPGITRGNHFHTRKVERFLVTEGRAAIRLRRVGYDDVTTFEVSGDRPVAIDIPTMHTHNITNTGSSTLTTLFWANEHFDPADADTYFLNVEPRRSE